MRIFLSSELCPQWQALRTKVQVRFKQLWGGGDSSTKWGHEDGKQKAWGSSRNSWWLQSTGANPTFQHPLHRCYPLECVESKSGHPKVWAFQPFEGMFPASLMEKTRMQKLLSSSIFSSLFPLNLCLQHPPPLFLSAFHKCLAKTFLSGGKPEGMPWTIGPRECSDGFFWETKPFLGYVIICHS